MKHSLNKYLDFDSKNYTASHKRLGMGLVVVVASVIVLADVAVAGCKTATTFNTALTTRVGNYYGRRGLIADALASESADILCLQEMW